MMLSAKPRETAAAVERLQQEAQQVKFRLSGMEMEHFAAIAREKQNQGDQLLFEEGLSSESVRKLAVQVMETCGGRCVVFSGSDTEGYKYAAGEKDGDLRQWTKAMNAALNGRGGGKPFFVQGSVRASRKEIEKFFETEN